MSIAICCVYYLAKPEDIEILKLQLSYIRRTTRDYKILAACSKVDEAALGLLSDSEDVIICDYPKPDAQGSREHAYYLDLLCQRAAEDGFEYICTFDMDSFPICEGWQQMPVTAIQSLGFDVVGVVRKENMDAVLVHPSFTFFTADWYRRHRPEFFPLRERIKEQAPKYLRPYRQTPDTGIGITLKLAQTRGRFFSLPRTNLYDFHYLMAGVYGNIVFHLGASSRKALRFRGDKPGPDHRREVFRHNASTREAILAELLSDSDGFMDKLCLIGAAPKRPASPDEDSPEE